MIDDRHSADGQKTPKNASQNVVAEFFNRIGQDPPLKPHPKIARNRPFANCRAKIAPNGKRLRGKAHANSCSSLNHPQRQRESKWGHCRTQTMPGAGALGASATTSVHSSSTPNQSGRSQQGERLLGLHGDHADVLSTLHWRWKTCMPTGLVATAV